MNVPTIAFMLANGVGGDLRSMMILALAWLILFACCGGSRQGPPVNADDFVPIDEACPNCGERHVDLLVWQGDADHVRCTRCGHCYLPPMPLAEEGGGA